MRWGISAFISILLISLLLGLIQSASAQITKIGTDPAAYRYYETPLKATGLVYEIYPDGNENLWVSDWIGEEIRRYSADGSQVDVFHLTYHNPGDARPAPDGKVWFVEQYYADLRIGRLDPSSGDGSFVVADYWDPNVGIFGIALDESGQVWFSGSGSTAIYYLNFDDLANHKLCSLNLKQGNSGYYIFYENGDIWMAEANGNRLLRLDGKVFNLTSWSLPTTEWDFEVKHLVPDGAGGIWFTDGLEKAIGRLDLSDPEHPVLQRFDRSIPPNQPNLLAVSPEWLWISDTSSTNGKGTLVAMGLNNLPSETYTPTTEEFPLDPPDCNPIIPSLSVPFEVTKTSPVWTEVDTSADESITNWLAVPLPSGSQPWGLAWQGDSLWSADQGRQVLIKVDTIPDQKIYLPLIQR